MSWSMILGVAMLCLCANYGTRVNAQACKKLHGAFTLWNKNFFIFGGKYELAGADKMGQIVVNGYASQTGFHDKITAAYGYPKEDTYYMQSGKEEKVFTYLGVNVEYGPRYRSGADDIFEEDPEYDGIDAALMRGDDAFYIAGCKYVVVNVIDNSVFIHGHVDDFGIPCHPDAAWTSLDGHVNYIAKGHKAYYWNLHDVKVGGVKSLFDVIPGLANLNLCM